MYEIKSKSRCAGENFILAIVYSCTVHAAKPRLLKALFDDIVLQIFTWFAWR